MAKLTAGDMVAYAARFLRDTAQHTGEAPQRRGTYVGPCPHLGADFARVRWHDIDYATYTDELGADHVESVRRLGSAVHVRAIARVGSARFALTDLP